MSGLRNFGDRFTLHEAADRHGIGVGFRVAHSGHSLYAHIVSGCQASSDKRICWPSMLAMEDGRIVDRTRLEAIYSIAVDHCIRSRGNTAD